MTVSDDDLGSNTKTRNVTVKNVAPTDLTADLSDDTIDENGSTDAKRLVHRSGTLDEHTVTIDWGDGSADTVLTLTVGDRTYSASHQYLDDNPTGTASDVYAISVDISDDDGGADSARRASRSTTSHPSCERDAQQLRPRERLGDPRRLLHRPGHVRHVHPDRQLGRGRPGRLPAGHVADLLGQPPVPRRQPDGHGQRHLPGQLDGHRRRQRGRQRQLRGHRQQRRAIRRCRHRDRVRQRGVHLLALRLVHGSGHP